MLWVRISIWARSTTLCDKVCQWLATGRWFSPGRPVSSTNKTDHHDLAEILLKVELNSIKQTSFNNICWHIWQFVTCTFKQIQMSYVCLYATIVLCINYMNCVYWCFKYGTTYDAIYVCYILFMIVKIIYYFFILQLFIDALRVVYLR
jgi:hypothetical protein